MFNVSPLKKYCDKCGKERQRLSHQRSIKKHYYDSNHIAKRRLYYHNQSLEILEAKNLMNIPKVIELIREKIMSKKE